MESGRPSSAVLKDNATLSEEALQERYKTMEQILWAVSEDNEMKAMAAVENQIEVGMVGYLGDVLTEWKYYLISTMSILIYRARDNEILYRYTDQSSLPLLKRIYAAQTEEECGEILREIVRWQCRAWPGRIRHVRECSALVQQIIAAVDTDLKEPLTLQYFADLLNVNSSYLSNLFKKETGETITEFVTTRRVRHAAYLLRHTQDPIKLVAKQVGITDVQYFSRLFKKKMKMTPTQYRTAPNVRE